MNLVSFVKLGKKVLCRRAHASWSDDGKYANQTDWQAVFNENKVEFYGFAMYLTQRPLLAEHCIATACSLCDEHTHVFKDRAHFWARRTVIGQAIKFCAPRYQSWDVVYTSDQEEAILPSASDGFFSATATLRDFERFVFVLSFVEKFNDQECSFLLNSSVTDVREARKIVNRRLAILCPLSRSKGMQFPRCEN